MILLTALGSSAVRAQATPSEPDGYRELIQAAIEEYDAHSYAEAQVQFRRAHALYPNARTLRGLGLAAYELRDYPDAIRRLEQALASKVKPLEGDTRTETEALVEKARGYVGTLHLKLDPPSATVTIDGHVRTESTEPLLLSIGEHILEFAAPQRLTQRRAVKIRGGETQTLEITLVDQSSLLANGAAPVNSTGEREPGRAPLYKKWWLWTTVGAAVVAGAVVGALYATRGEQERGIGTTNTPRDGDLSTRATK